MSFMIGHPKELYAITKGHLSSLSGIPSPSVSGFNGLVISPFGLAGVFGLSTPVNSSPFVKPSLSQSNANQAELTLATTCLTVS